MIYPADETTLIFSETVEQRYFRCKDVYLCLAQSVAPDTHLENQEDLHHCQISQWSGIKNVELTKPKALWCKVRFIEFSLISHEICY